MKFLLLILLLPAFATAQTEPVPPKKAKKIHIANTDSVAITVKKIAMNLLDRGYFIDSKDEQLGYITTSEKSFGDYSLKIRAMVKDKLIILSAGIALNIELSLGGATTSRTFDDVINGWGLKKSPRRASWEELVTIARSLGVITKYE